MTMLTDPNSIYRYGLAVLRHRLKLELKMPISVDEIKKRYKKLVKIFHPDVNDNNKNAESKFKEITKAYKILLKKFLRNE